MHDYPWIKNYPAGISDDIDPDRFSSIIHLLEDSFKEYGNRTAYENMGKKLSFIQMDRLSAQFADFLQNTCLLKPGDRIAVQMPNLLQWPVVVFGAIRAGMIVVNTNPLYTSREMLHQFQDAGVKAIVILANFASNLQKIIHETEIKTVVITEVGDMFGGIKKSVVNFVVRHIKKMVPSYKIEGAISFKHAMKSGKKGKFITADKNGDDIAFLQYTGGTTGISKGAVLSHRNILANMEQICEWMKPKLGYGKEIMVTALPLYHIFALTVNCLAMLRIGASNILITNPRDMKDFLGTIKKIPFSIITGVNTLFNGMLNHPDFKKCDFSNLKVSVGGGMAVQDAVADKWKKITGTALVEGYGLTETSPLLCCNPIDDTERTGTIGMPVPGTEIQIMDDSGTPLPVGEVGELCARGPQVMKEYWHKPDETRLVFVNGYFRTGDIAVMDNDGFLKIVDRKKEMINVSGFNVYPNDIENVIASHPKVQEVGAIGVPDSKSTEIVKVFIVKKDESLTEKEILEYCKENLTRYKMPRVVEFRKELPKSNVGKILRRVLKEEES